MIFLTVGSHEPFDRLVRAVDAYAAEHPGKEILGQITDRPGYVPTRFEWVENLDPADYRAACARTTCFLAHAGMGTIITALQLGKPVVIVPRRMHLGETRNDHQVSTAERFRDKPGVFVADTEADLPAALTRALAGQGPGAVLPPYAEDRLIAFLRAEALDQ